MFCMLCVVCVLLYAQTQCQVGVYIIDTVYEIGAQLFLLKETHATKSSH